MTAINIRKAKRVGARLVIGLIGTSGSGKTYTGLQLAWGLAGGNAAKVGLLDTENKRGSLYADILKDKVGKVHEFLVGDLDPPFHPDRYVEAIKQFQEAGVEVLVIDSYSHAWEGIGGCQEIAEKGGKVNGWKIAKGAHKRLIYTALASDMHVVLCIRAREQMDFTDTSKPKSLGVQPVCEKNVPFELTASMMMNGGGKHREVLKTHADLIPIIGDVGWHEGYLSAKHGLAIRQWVDGGESVDSEVERSRNMLRMSSEQGVAAFDAAVAALSKRVVKALKDGGDLATLRAAAEAFDTQERGESGASLDGINADLAADAADAAG